MSLCLNMQQPIDIPSAQRTYLQYHVSSDAYLSTSPSPLASESEALRLSNTPSLINQSSLPQRRTGIPPNPTAMPPHNRQSEHQWTLFGQLMENEGHLGVTTASKSNRSLRNSKTEYFTHRGGNPSDPSHFLEHNRRLDQPVLREESPLHDDLTALGNPLDEECDSDDYSSPRSVYQSASSRRTWFSCPSFRKLSSSLVWRNVLKCAIAYFIGSLFTFSPYFSRLLVDVTSGSSPIPSPSGHMVATM